MNHTYMILIPTDKSTDLRYVPDLPVVREFRLSLPKVETWSAGVSLRIRNQITLLGQEYTRRTI